MTDRNTYTSRDCDHLSFPESIYFSNVNSRSLTTLLRDYATSHCIFADDLCAVNLQWNVACSVTPRQAHQARRGCTWHHCKRAPSGYTRQLIIAKTSHFRPWHVSFARALNGALTDGRSRDVSSVHRTSARRRQADRPLSLVWSRDEAIPRTNHLLHL